MGMTAALLALDAAERLEGILGVELLCAAQALDAAPGRPGAGVAALHAEVRRHVPVLVEDRVLAPEIATAAALVRDGAAAAHLHPVSQGAR